MLSKHTARYMKEFHDHYSESFSFDSLARIVDAGGEDGYIFEAINTLEDETEKNVLKERLLKKKMRWD